MSVPDRPPQRPPRDPAAVYRFIERFASTLADAGMARMPARVFVALLASDAGRLSSAELSALLGVSPAAISGAVRYLTQVNLASREREPGSRRDYYRVHEDVWYDSAIQREQMLRRWSTSAAEGIEALGRDTPAGARIARSLMFFEFLQAELPGLLERWRQAQAPPGERPAAEADRSQA